MKKLGYTFLLFFISNILYAQTGKIIGKVISASSGQTLSGATLYIIEKKVTRIADQNGVFVFNKLDSGNYSIKCSYTGFQDKIIEDVFVKQNELTEISISLEVKLSGEVIVTSTRRVKAAGATVESLLIVQKNSANVSDGVTAETIKKTPDKSSSDVIKRVSGASIQDDKFAIIRGLNDRYNAAFINGAPLPSTESDRKAFAFDIFPSSILDNLVIFKTATPDKTAEFGGGIIEITTKATSSKPVSVISVGQSFNSLITGKVRLFSEMKSKTDWLGLDDGTRALPKNIPADLNTFNSTPELGLKLAKDFGKYKWGVKSANTKPNFNFQLAKSFNINRKEQEFISSLFSVTYNKGYTFTTGERNSFDGPGSYIGNPTDPGYYPIQRRRVIDSTYNEEIVWAALGNFFVKINNQNSIGWKNNLSVNTDNKLVRRVGNSDYTNDSANITSETFRQFTSDMIYSSQIVGDHQITKLKTKINWLAAFSKVSREIPIQLISYNIGPLYQDGMVSTNSQENIKNFKVEITQPYKFMKSSQNFLKIGSGYQIRQRDFTSRILGFTSYRGSLYQIDDGLNNLPEDQRFLEQYLGLQANGKTGLTVRDFTVPNSEYIASSTTAHAYIMNDQRFFKKLRAIYGIRVENFYQKLTAPQRGQGEVNIDYGKVDFLPSVNVVYALSPKTNLRLSYSETLNRPEYRELATFGFTEYVSGLFVFGNPTLTRAKLNNFDFRYEIYPGKSQLFSFSAFYKNFKDPIEFSISPTYPTEASYYQVPKAKVFGIETEFRVLLSTLFNIKRENALISKFTLAGNGAYIKSQVPQVKSDSSTFFRPLQGQSPYIVNLSLGFADETTGLSSTISFNKTGERLALAGSRVLPDYYEKVRNVIDFQLAKSFLKNRIELKLNIRELLAQNFVTYLDNDKTKSFTEQDRIFSSNKAPRVISFTGTIKF